MAAQAHPLKNQINWTGSTCYKKHELTRRDGPFQDLDQFLDVLLVHDERLLPEAGNVEDETPLEPTE